MYQKAQKNLGRILDRQNSEALGSVVYQKMLKYFIFSCRKNIPLYRFIYSYIEKNF